MPHDFSRFYRTRIKKSLDEDRHDIAKAFEEVIKGHGTAKLRLVNYYKGLPINYPASLVEVSRGILDLDVHQQQAVALSDSRYTFIKCDHFDGPILAEVHSVDVRRRAASVRNFVFVDIMAEQRTAVRLDLDPPVQGELKVGTESCPAEVLDVSLGGFSMRIRDQWFPDGSDVKLRIKVPDAKSVDLDARHVGTFKGCDWDICRFSVQVDPAAEGLISRFMLQRQVEIIRELKERSD